MKHVDALSRHPSFTINLIREVDWIQCVQSQDEDCKLVKAQLLNNTADVSYKLIDDKICRLIDNKPKIVIPQEVRWRIVKLYHDDNGHPRTQRTLEAM